MKISISDMWAARPDIWVVTTNAVLDHHNALVMGKGAALGAKRQFPNVEYACGWFLRWWAECTAGSINNPESLEYGFRLIMPRFGIFQVKYAWKEPAALDLLMHSTAMLAYYAREHSWQQIAMNYPGIGAGGLDEAEVEKIVCELPDNVTLYKLGETP